MIEQSSNTYIIKIYLSGPIDIISQICREYCLKKGLCVTINKTLFIYSGGEEFGVEIGLINYPRFPTSNIELIETATDLAKLCRDKTFQWSYLIITPEYTIWSSIREK